MPVNKHTIQFPFDESDLQRKIAYDVNGRPEYLGRARAGALATAPEWQIQKLTYDPTTGLCTAIQFANGLNDYNAVWNDRATYSYA